MWKHYNLDLYERRNKLNINQDRGDAVISWLSSEYDDKLARALQDIAAKSEMVRGYLDFMADDDCDISVDSLCDYIHEEVKNWDEVCSDLCLLSAAMPELLFEVEVRYDDSEYSDWRVIARNGEYWTVDVVQYFPSYDELADGSGANV